MNEDFDDIFSTIAELAMEYASRRLRGEKPRLRFHVEFEDATGDTTEEVHGVFDPGTGTVDRPRKAATAPRIRRKALR